MNNERNNCQGEQVSGKTAPAQYTREMLCAIGYSDSLCIHAADKRYSLAGLEAEHESAAR